MQLHGFLSGWVAAFILKKLNLLRVPPEVELDMVSASGGTVHTIEGNASNRIQRRSYGVDDARIVGYTSPAGESGGGGWCRTCVPVPAVEERGAGPPSGRGVVSS